MKRTFRTPDFKIDFESSDGRNITCNIYDLDGNFFESLDGFHSMKSALRNVKTLLPEVRGVVPC